MGLDTIMLGAAVGLDLVLGDPHGWPHPVRALGAAADRLEAAARRAGTSLRLRGALCVVVLAAGAAGAAWALAALPMLGGLLALYLAYSGLALGSLLREGRRVLARLDEGDLPGAREAVSMLVSRDTSELDEEGVCRTLAETLSENLGDGFVAPFFWLALGGVPGLWAYKAVSTLDSMWGYKTERWREFGWAAARTDDALAWVPSRLAGAAILLAGRLPWVGVAAGAGEGATLGAMFRGVREDAGKTSSPNAGWPMAAAAWALGAPVGGSAVYFGEMVAKPTLGPQGGAWNRERVRRLLRLLPVAGVLAALPLAALSALLAG